MEQVKDRERIIQAYRALVYVIWDCVKNGGENPEAENYAPDYVLVISGMRGK